MGLASPRLRFQVTHRRRELDLRLAAGEDFRSDRALACRADQLLNRSARRGLAGSIRHLLDAAEEPPEAVEQFSPPLQRDAVLAARRPLLSLAGALDGDAPISPRAAALAALLVLDRRSPIYEPAAPEPIAAVVARVLGHDESAAS